MRSRPQLTSLAACLIATAATTVLAQSADPPHTVTAGSAFSIPTSGSGSGTLYIVGPDQALHRDVQLGRPISFAAGDLYNAGDYLVILVAGTSTTNSSLDVQPAPQPQTIGFLAKPSRLPVGLHDGISGAAYLFDAWHNLVTQPMPVSFQLANASSPAQSRTVTSRNGVAWTEMDSSAKEGTSKFVASAAGVSSTRVIDEVPGDPCGLSMSAHPDGRNLLLQTAPVRDCSGNPVPDGTVVTFTETWNGSQSTVDVPLKQGAARVVMPAYPGATISVASGVVAGNEIRWGGGR